MLQELLHLALTQRKHLLFLNKKLDFIGFLESLWRNPKALLFFIKVHVDENNIEMSTSRPRKFKMWTRYVILLIRGTSVLERSMTMGDVLIKARTRNSGKVVYEYRFEVASIDGKRQWKSKSGFATKREAGKIAQQHMNMWDKLLNLQI